jgi:hypothetical protein
MAINSSGNSVEHSVAGKITVSTLASFDAEGVDCSDIAGKHVKAIATADKHNKPAKPEKLIFSGFAA